VVLAVVPNVDGVGVRVDVVGCAVVGAHADAAGFAADGSFISKKSFPG